MRYWIVLGTVLCGASFQPASARALATQEVESDFRTSHEAYQKLGRLADNMRRRGDRRGLFADVYVITIRAVAANLSAGRFHNKRWVNQLVLNYANIYRRTIAAELIGRRRSLSLGWQLDFDYDTRAVKWEPDLALVYAINVHIARDLVEALQLTPTRYHSPSVRADYFYITEILRAAMPQIWSTLTSYGNNPGIVPAGLQQWIVMNWIARLRQRAWDDATASHRYTPAQKRLYLRQIDQMNVDMASTYGMRMVF